MYSGRSLNDLNVRMVLQATHSTTHPSDRFRIDKDNLDHRQSRCCDTIVESKNTSFMLDLMDTGVRACMCLSVCVHPPSE